MRTSCIRLRAKARIAILFEDFLEICNGNMLAAMLLAILVYWTDVKLSKKDSNLWIWKSHVDFQEDLMFDKPGMKPPHRTTIKSALDLLVEKKYVYRRKNPKMPLDQTKQYLVDQKAVQAAIDALPPIVVLPTLESRNSDNATSNNQQSLSENQQCNAEKPTSNTNDYPSMITDPVITEEGTDDFAVAPSSPALDDAFPESELEQTAKRAAVKPENVTPVTAISSDSQATTQGEDDGHLSQPAAPDVDSDDTRSGGVALGQGGANDGERLASEQTIPISPFTTGAASALGSPSESGSLRGMDELREVTKTKRKSKARAEPVLKCDPAEVQRRINERRGYALEEKVAIIRERTAIKAWCGLHTLDEFEVVMTQLQEHDPYWKKPENKYRITGNTLAVETPKILAKRNGQTPPEPERTYTGFDVYKGNGPEERAYYAAIGASLPDSYFDQ